MGRFNLNKDLLFNLKQASFFVFTGYLPCAYTQHAVKPSSC